MRKLEHIGGKAFGTNRKGHLMAKKNIKILSLCCHLHRLPKAKWGAARNNRRATLGTRQESLYLCFYLISLILISCCYIVLLVNH